MTVRRVIRGIGKTFIGAGMLIFLFVAYQLWGTGVAESRSQRSLEKSFNQSVGTGTTPSTASQTPVTTSPPELGDAVALISIPKIDVEKYVVEGVGVEDLKEGPGHYPDTPMPGEPGNAAIAGHRTTYGAPFYSLDKLTAGDSILVTTHAGRFQYDVQELKIVGPNDAFVLDPTDDNRLTLTTCNPRYSAAQRLIVVAQLIGTPLPEPEPAPAPAPEPGAEAEPAPPETAPPVEVAGSLSGDRAAAGPAVLWGLLAAVVLFATWLLGWLWKRWPAYLIGTPVFLLVLFMFFENFSRLLPANI
ncbi:MAG: class E sortase [Actinomycetota bacterium]|nr:class E sortase [Actinomycetota bacterium]